MSDLVPRYLSTLPLDPLDGSALRYRQDPLGVVIYVTGGDGEDDGGDFWTLNSKQPGTDVGFRLWHPVFRGIPEDFDPLQEIPNKEALPEGKIDPKEGP